MRFWKITRKKKPNIMAVEYKSVIDKRNKKFNDAVTMFEREIDSTLNAITPKKTDTAIKVDLSTTMDSDVWEVIKEYYIIAGWPKVELKMGEQREGGCYLLFALQ
jgi:hypothetical protein